MGRPLLIVSSAAAADALEPLGITEWFGGIVATIFMAIIVTVLSMTLVPALAAYTAP